MFSNFIIVDTDMITYIYSGHLQFICVVSSLIYRVMSMAVELFQGGNRKLSVYFMHHIQYITG